MSFSRSRAPVAILQTIRRWTIKISPYRKSTTTSSPRVPHTGLCLAAPTTVTTVSERVIDLTFYSSRPAHVVKYDGLGRERQKQLWRTALHASKRINHCWNKDARAVDDPQRADRQEFGTREQNQALGFRTVTGTETDRYCDRKGRQIARRQRQTLALTGGEIENG